MPVNRAATRFGLQYCSAILTSPSSLQTQHVQLSGLVEASANDLKGVQDLLQLESLHEATLLYTLRRRFAAKKTYVRIIILT